MEVMILKDRLPRWFLTLPSWVRRLTVLVIGSIVLVLGRSRASTERRKALILGVLDGFGQPLTVIQGYVSMLADGTLASLNGHTGILQRECERMRGLTSRLVQEIRSGR